MATDRDHRVSMENPERWYGDAQEFWKVGVFSMTSFICSCVRQKIDNSSLERSLVSKLVMRDFGPRKTFEKSTRNTSLFWQTKGALT